MSPKPSPDSLIHCAVCGEDYSATYRRCPFCGAKNDPASVPAPYSPPTPPARGRSEDDDGYVFDGQDLFDDEPEDDGYTPVRPGKRLAEKSGGRFDLASAPINWPRLITFICSLIIIVAALVIVFTVIYPQLSGSKDKNKDPDSTISGAPDNEPSAPVAPPSAPVANNPVDTDPNPADSTEPSQPVTSAALTSMRLNRDDFTLRPGESFKLEPTFNPADWSGTVTWTSSDESLARVAADGTVTHVGANVTTVHRVIVTASAGGIETQCIVFIAGPLNPSMPPVQSDPPQADPPAAPSQSSSGGGVTVGRQGTIVNAEGGLRVRSGPGTTYEILATLLNGNTVNVISSADGTWYQISFTGSGGSTITGYIMGEYISTN